jgi:hypothetical protein
MYLFAGDYKPHGTMNPMKAGKENVLFNVVPSRLLDMLVSFPSL